MVAGTRRALEARLAVPCRRRLDRAPAGVTQARLFVESVLRRHHAEQEVIDAFRLAVSELGANVVVHGQHPRWTVVIVVTRSCYAMDVRGGSASRDSIVFRPEQWAIAAVEEPAGRGLGIVRSLMDHVTVDTRRRQVRVRCRLRRAP